MNKRSCLDTEKPFQAELIQYNDQESLCWIEVADGIRVRAKVPTPLIKAALLDEGDEFLWYPTSLKVKKVETEDGKERNHIIEELEILKKHFHEELKHIDTGLETNSE